MAAFLSLPNELILEVYTRTSTLKCAARLSSTNKWLRSIWLENDIRITEGILRPHIPSYEDAEELAILEETVINNIQLSRAKSRIPICFYVRRLVHNASLASSAATAWTRWLAGLPAHNYRHQRNYTSLYASYYLMRKILLAHQYPESQLHQALFSTLHAASRDAVLTHTEFSSFLLGYFGDEIESQRHGIFKNEEDWTEEDEMEHEMGSNVIVEEWGYVGDVLHAAMLDKVHGYQKLEGQLFNNI